MKIARLTDRFEIKLGEVSLEISPLSGRQKIEMTSLIKQDDSGRLQIDKPAQELYLVKHSIKAINGLKDNNDNDYELQFKDGSLTDECADELLGFLANTFFTTANTQAMRGLFGEVVSPITGKPIQGVSVTRLVKKEDEKK